VDGYGPNHSADMENFERSKGAYSLMLVAVKGLVPELEGYAEKVVWVPQYFDNIFFSPSIGRTDEYDVCFLGNLNPNCLEIRKKFIEELNKKYKLIVGGSGLGPMYYGTSCADFYMRSKIAVELPKGIPNRELLFSDRIYRAMGLGCLFITLDSLGIEQMFTPGIHLDVYDGTVGGLCERIDYYLEHEDERKKIALEGQKEILEKHTISVRVKQYLEEIKKVL
jgi:spore maturation protein CgeB